MDANYSHQAPADQVAIERAQEYQKQLEQQQLRLQREKQAEADAQLAADIRRRAEESGQK